jgi:hypothetical protein
MNDRDRSNLNFLLSIDESTFKDWYSKMEDDDIVYAQELLAEFAQELKEKSKDLRIEAELSMMKTYSDAESVLAKVLK